MPFLIWLTPDCWPLHSGICWPFTPPGIMVLGDMRISYLDWLAPLEIFEPFWSIDYLFEFTPAIYLPTPFYLFVLVFFFFTTRLFLLLALYFYFFAMWCHLYNHLIPCWLRIADCSSGPLILPRRPDKRIICGTLGSWLHIGILGGMKQEGGEGEGGEWRHRRPTIYYRNNIMSSSCCVIVLSLQVDLLRCFCFAGQLWCSSFGLRRRHVKKNVGCHIWTTTKQNKVLQGDK